MHSLSICRCYLTSMIGRRTIKLPKSHMVYWMCLQLLVFSAGQDSTLEKCASLGLEYRSLIGWLPGGNLPNAWRVVGKTVRGCEQSPLSCWGSWLISLHKNQRVFFLLAADGHSLNQTCILSFFFFPLFECWGRMESGEKVKVNDALKNVYLTVGRRKLEGKSESNWLSENDLSTSEIFSS